MTYYLLTILFLLFLGAASSATSAERSAKSDRLKIYWNETFVRLINFLIWPALILALVILYMNWKLSLVIIFLALFLQGIILKPIAEKIIVLPLHLLLKNKG
ncbi:MAG: hypothetical protein UT48_C0033G0008 [Parcubacteria group bacterium GW2011_GWE2_39_37]|uniref:Uncharacterized protein n=1 Tax=Candidatus Falkowbacteria bacterium GW2011_GWF2_39_8 TaxID=1618642 RepID=A0A0G0PVD2_9BACT|nr:MAG: hypothetical protein UT48_C0033G0008 [Parcubacteria group bacterium GW2011_GWE2_39_37]KKR32099.1 MAG: hypothetical protein UT64_C0042G0006 [Candidatus Falkowbacteria bacterium GW2011_GWF2_39_8]